LFNTSFFAGLKRGFKRAARQPGPRLNLRAYRKQAAVFNRVFYGFQSYLIAAALIALNRDTKKPASNALKAGF